MGLKCINKNSPEYIKLAESFGKNTTLLDVIIQRYNNKWEKDSEKELEIPPLEIVMYLLDDVKQERSVKTEDTLLNIKNQIKDITDSGFGVTNKQVEVVQNLIHDSEDIVLDELTRNYVQTETGKEFKNTHTVIDLLFPQDQFNKKTEGQDIAIESRVEFGHEINDVLDAIVLKKTEQEAWEYVKSKAEERGQDFPFINYKGGDKSVFQEVYNILDDYISYLKSKQYLILIQRIAINREEGIAGRPDLTIVNTSGQIRNIDLKTSIYSFIHEYYNISGNKNNYKRGFSIVYDIAREIESLKTLVENNKEELKETNNELRKQVLNDIIASQEKLIAEFENNNIPYKEKASRYIQHSRQVLIYDALDISNGYRVLTGEIFPITLDPVRDSNGNIESINNISSEIKSEGRYTIPVNNTTSDYKTIYENVAKSNKLEVDIHKEATTNVMDSLVEIYERRVETGEFYEKEENHIKESKILVKKINSLTDAQKLANYIKYVNNKFGKDGVIINEFKNLIALLEEGTSTISIAKLNYYRRMALDFDKTIGRLNRHLNSVKNNTEVDDILEDSPLGMLENISNNIRYLMDTHVEKVKPAMADWIMNNIKGKQTGAGDKVKNTKRKLEEKFKKLTASGKKVSEMGFFERRRYNLIKSQLDNINRIESPLSKKSILKMLNGIDVVDEGFLEYWWTSIVNCPDKLTSTFAVIFKDRLYQADEYMMDKQYQLMEAYDKYVKDTGKNKNNVEELFKEIIEESTIVLYEPGGNTPVLQKILSFVRPLDYNKYNKDYLDNYTKATSTPGKYWDIMESFFKKALKPKNNANEIMTDYLKILNNNKLKDKIEIDNIIHWVFENINVRGLGGWLTYDRESSQTLKLNESFSIDLEFAKYSLEETIQNNSKIKYSIGLRNELLEINGDENHYHNKNYDKLLNNNGELNSYGKYHEIITDIYLEQQKLIPPDKRLGYRLPSVTKEGIDRFRKNPLDWFKYEWRDLGHGVIADETMFGTGENGIPIFYTNPNIDIEDVSKDVYQSVLMFMNSAQRYKAVVSMYEESNVLLDIYKNRELKTKTGKLIKSSRKGNDIDQNYLTRHLYEFINSEIYGKRSVPINIMGVRGDKIIDSMMRLFSIKDIGNPLNVITGLANSLQAEAQLLTESAAGEFMTMETTAKAGLIVTKETFNLLKDFDSPAPISLFGQLMEHYQCIQGEFQTELGHRVSAGTAKRLLSGNMWFLNMHLPDMRVQMKTMTSILLNKKVEDENGKLIPLFYAYELNEKGKLSLKKGIKLQNASTNGLIDQQIKNTVHQLNKRMHGIYNTYDRPNIEKLVGGRLLQMYRKYLVPAFKKRYKTVGWDAEGAMVTEGFYNTVLRKLIDSRRDAITTCLYLLTGSSKLNDGLGLDFNTYDSYEQANLRRTRADIFIMMFLTMVIMMLKKLKGDDDDKNSKLAISYPLYWMMRLKSDQVMYVDPLEWERIMKNPTAAQNTLNRGLQLVTNIFVHHPFDWSDESLFYKKDEGIAKKGDRKSWIMFRKFIGNMGTNMDPAIGIKFLDQFNLD